MDLAQLVKCMASGEGARVVVIVSYGTMVLEGFEQLGRDALLMKLHHLKQEALATGSPRVLCLHVPRDTVPPVAALRAADVVLDVRKVRGQ